MSSKTKLVFVLAVLAVGGSTWLLAQKSRESSRISGRESVVYSICSTNNGVLMLDQLRGKTWMLYRAEAGEITWLPIRRIESDKEASQLWQKNSANSLNVGRKGDSLSIDALLKEQGYIGFPLNRLKTGYVALDLRVEGKKVFLAVDTAAPFTHLDMDRVKHLQLKWQPYGKEESKGESLPTQASSWCEITKLEIGELDIGRLVVGGHDLSDINNNLKLYLDPQIDGVLGSDVLTKTNAIIDYSALKMYICPREKQRGHRLRQKKSVEKKRGRDS